MTKRHSVCHSCGKEVEFGSEEPPCKALDGWLTISCWKGEGSVNHYSFCSFLCLQRWVDDQIPRVPEVFLKSLEDKSE